MRDLTLYIDNLDGDLFVAIPNPIYFTKLRRWEVAGYLDLCEDQYLEYE